MIKHSTLRTRLSICRALSTRVLSTKKTTRYYTATNFAIVPLIKSLNNDPDNKHLSQSRRLDVVLVRLQRPRTPRYLAFLPLFSCLGQVLDVAKSALSASNYCAAPHITQASPVIVQKMSISDIGLILWMSVGEPRNIPNGTAKTEIQGMPFF